MKNYSKTVCLLLSALFAALTAIGSYISVPLPFTPVPVNLATLSVFLAGGLLGWKYGSLSQIVYLLLGSVGVPVFHNFTGGLGILTGPTGGYIVGYVCAALLMGLLCGYASETSIIRIIASMIVSLISCYFLGTIWFMISSGTGFTAALTVCVLPFLPGDAVKIAAGCILIKKLRSVVI